MNSSTDKTDDNDKRSIKTELFSAKGIARIAVFTAFAYLLYLPVFEFSIIPAVPFLKIDFSNACVVMAGFALGPLAGIIVGILKELLHALTFSQTVGVGELANILIMLPYELIPSIAYMRKRKIKTAIISLSVACVIQSVWSIPINYLLTFPFYLMAYGGANSWNVGMELYLSVWGWAVLFNLVKSLLISIATLLLYKRLQKLFILIFRENKKKMNDHSNNRQNVNSSTDNDNSELIGTHIVDSPQQMEELGERMAKMFVGGEIILLSGELGAGKTVFCKGIAKGLGVEEEIVSPTFTLMNEHNGRIKFNHIDAYRLSSADEAEASGLTEYINGNDVCAVEWWENIDGIFDEDKTLSVIITKKKDNQNIREVKIAR